MLEMLLCGLILFAREFIDWMFMRAAIFKSTTFSRDPTNGRYYLVLATCLSMASRYEKFVLPVEGGSVVVGRIKEVLVS